MRHIHAIRMAVAMLLVLSWLVGHSQPGPGSPATDNATNGDGPPISRLTEDLLSRLEAVEADIESSDDIETLADDNTQTGSTTMADSIVQAGDRIDADPRKRALLERHDFDGRSYVRAYMSLVHAQLNAIVSQGNGQAQGVPPRVRQNIAFYEKHETRIDQFLARTGTRSPQMSEKSSRNMKRLTEMDPDRMQDCFSVAGALIPLLPLGVPGSVAVDNKQLQEIAGMLSDSARELHADAPREHINTVADVLRKHPGHAPLESPRVEAAIAELKAWSDTNCKELEGEPS